MALIKDIQPRGIASAYSKDKPFDEGKAELEQDGYHVISLEENARLRIQEGKDSYVSQNGNWVKEGFLYIPRKGKFLTKTSPIIVNSVEATKAHRSGNEFYLTDEQVEQGLADSLKLKDRGFSVPTKRFGDDELTVYAFRNSAQVYGDFLKDAGIEEMPVWMVNNIGDKPFARQAWFDRLDFGSRLVGYVRGLGVDYRVRGVREDALASEPSKTAVGGSKPTLYSPKQISRALTDLGFSGLNDGLLKKLHQ
ncbi:hypothetical protein A3K82_00595 [Candidatus Pacearchaeota archaeon RBG_19FT_COMBO_34_9]|nr:MAG: hypothetical protein A3K82_00595 [Candidatus Pacearchaeota archaeon RBG_19FT_COMBO_34_9]